MRIEGFKIDVAVSVVAEEIKDTEEYGKGINIGAHVNVELKEAEISVEETKEMFNSVNELIHTELTKEVRKNKDIKFLEKELDMKNKELEKFRNE